MQLLKQIWNERRSNGWLWSELLIVFVVLWYVVDWTYVTARTYYEPVGFDITDTYYLELSLKNDKSNSYLSKEQKSTSLGQDIIELTNRLRRLPEVEAVSISNNARPYIGSNSGSMLRIDTLVSNPLRRSVTPDFFQVFRYQSADGRGWQPLVQALKNGNVVVGENFWPKDYKGDRTLLGKEMVDVDDSTKVYKIGGVSKKVRYNDFWPNYSDRYVAIELPEKIMVRTQHRRAESALRIAVGASRMQLWQRLNKEGLLLLTLAALPAAVICYNIGHLELTEGYMEWGVVRFLITFVITYFLMSLMILVGIWFPARQVIRIHPAEALREE